MTAPMSVDLRRRLARAVECSASIREAVRDFEGSPSAAIKLMDQRRRIGSREPGRVGSHRKPVLTDHSDLIQALAETHPHISLAELQARSGAHRELRVVPVTFWMTLRQLGPPHKDV